MSIAILIVATIVAVFAVTLIAFLYVRKQINIQTFEGFMSEQECQHFIDLASLYLENNKQELPKNISRSSTPIYLQSHDEQVQIIRQRAANLLKVPESYIETLQVVRYTLTQEYLVHVDWFGDNFEDPKASSAVRTRPHYQRQTTILVYLNDVARGGETYFPYLRKKILPRAGMAVRWKNLWANGKGNKFTAHSALPVTKGEKWAVNIWVGDQAA